MQKDRISLLIPTLNAGDRWNNLLKSIEIQSVSPLKKIIIDSGSNDDTVSLAKTAGFEVLVIDKNEFNHGATRQKLVDLSTDCDICIFLTQDTILASVKSIENLTNVFFEHQKVGMAYGRQLPHKNAKALEAHNRLYNYPSDSEILSIDDLQRRGFRLFFSSDSFAAYRKDILYEIGGFPLNSIMGEDAVVAAKMLSAGFKKAYVADATVYHSHNYSLIEEYKRYFDTRVFHEQNVWLLRKFGKPTGEGLKFVKSELVYSIKNSPGSLLKSITSVFAKWLGYNSGRFFKILPKPLLKKLSMHSFYWK